jgi:hypothetical protein
LLRTDFEEPRPGDTIRSELVTGPIVLGRLAHFGLGRSIQVARREAGLLAINVGNTLAATQLPIASPLNIDRLDTAFARFAW